MDERLHDLVEVVVAARGDPGRAVLEGLHPLKHAVRFGAPIERVVVPDGLDLRAACARLAPDLPDRLTVEPTAVPDDAFARFTSVKLVEPVVAVARRPVDDAAAVAAGRGAAPIVLLEAPGHLGNLGAAVRTAAAAGADAVLTTGGVDPWHAAALRGSAGLHFALPVGRVPTPPAGPRPVVGFDPHGEAFDPDQVAPDAILAFGTERHGLSGDLLDRADQVVAIPMRPGVSSLNLGVSVGIALYLLRPDAGLPSR